MTDIYIYDQATWETWLSNMQFAVSMEINGHSFRFMCRMCAIVENMVEEKGKADVDETSVEFGGRLCE